MSRMCTGFAFLILVSLIFVACGSEPSPANGVSGSGPVPSPTPIPSPTPFSVSAEVLQNEKELNEVAWKNKYNDRIALIEGTIKSVTEAGNKYDIKLETGNFTVDVVCKVDKDYESAVVSLQQGQNVSVLGQVTDDGILDIVVKDCSLASAGGAQQIPAQGQVAKPTNTAEASMSAVATAMATATPTTTLEPSATPASIPTPGIMTPTVATQTPPPNVPPTPAPTPTSIPPGMTLDNPVAAGEVLQGSDGTEIVVTGISEDAADLVMDANQFNDPPEPGNRFYMVTVAVSYVSGADSLNVAESDYSLIGNKRVVYTPFDHTCGVIPDELSAELFPGGQTEGNVCFQIEANDGNFVLIHESFFSFESERRFLSIDPQSSGSVADFSPVPLTTPSPEDLALPPGMALDNPVAAGEVLQGSDGTEIVVTGISEDAADLVMDANQFNDPPEPGNQFYMVTVAVSYVSGADSLNVGESDYSLIGNNRVVYTPFEHNCGVIPGELESELFPGGQAAGNVCFQVEASDGNFVLIHEPFYSFEGERRFLSLE